MKHFNSKNTIALALVALISYLSINSKYGPYYSVTGASFGNGTCGSYSSSCHVSAGSYTNPNLKIELLDGSTPVTTYTSNKSYTVRYTITANNTSGAEYGFETTCVQSSTSNDINNWGSLPSGTKGVTLSSRRYIMHSAPSNTNVFSIPWTSPSTTTGNITFYGAGLIGNGDNKSSGDNFSTSTLTVSPASSGCQAPTLSVSNLTHVDCYGASTGAITVSTSGGSSPFSFDWSGPNSYSANTQNISGLKAGLYTLIVTAKGGCKDTLKVSLTQPSSKLTVTTNANTPLCVGEALSFYANANGGNFGHKYSWKGPAGVSSNTPVFNVNPVTYAMNGDFILTVTDAKNCQIKDTVHVEVDSMPTTEGINANPLSWNTYQFSGINPKFVRKYQWLYGDGKTDTTANPGHTFTSKGAYTTKLIVSNTCGADTYSVYVPVWPANIGVKVKESPNIRVYPNPAQSKITIEPTRGQTIKEINMWSVTGTLVYHRQVNDHRNLNVDVRDLPDGIYGLYIVTDKDRNFYPVNVTH